MSTETLPNSLPRIEKIDWNMSRGGSIWMYLYCANCGADGGRVMKTDMPEEFAFYLCDERQNNCAAKWAELAGTIAIPDEVFFEKVRQAQMEKYGRILTPEEVGMELQDESSMMSKLKREAS